MKRGKKILQTLAHFFMASLLTIGSIPLNFINAHAVDTTVITLAGEADDVPDHSKDVTPNGDGTYNITLSVTGKQSSETTVSKANVVIVFDTSNSMEYGTGCSRVYNYNNNSTGQYGLVDGNYVPLYRSYGAWRYGTNQTAYNGNHYTCTSDRLTVAKNATTNLITTLLNNNHLEDAESDTVEISLVNFATGVRSTTNWSTNGTTLNNTINGYDVPNSIQGGTNWEAALSAAKDLVNNRISTQPGETNHVIFVSDGDPTFRDSQMGATGYTTTRNGGWNADANKWGSGSSDPNSWNFNAAKAVADSISGLADTTLYTIGAFGNATTMQNLAGADNYHDASDQQALNAAFDQIVNQITNALSLTNLKFTDGITALTTAAVNGNAGNFVYTKGGTTWADAPEAEIRNVNGVNTVVWDLGDTTLKQGETATVSFTVWPSQESYDLLADLNNGKKDYDELTDAQKASIVKTGDTYGLQTNTESPTLTYSTVETTTVNGVPTTTISEPTTIKIPNKPPVPLTTKKLTLEKKWEDSLDPSQREEVEGEVVLDFYKDGTIYEGGIRLTEETNWKLSDYISIAPGILISESSSIYNSVKEGHTEYTFQGKKYIILEAGHDYYFDEQDINGHFELTNYIYHPMLVDNVLKNVFFTKDSAGNITGIEEFKTMDSVSATNTLKGGINIEKKVVDKNGNPVDTTDSFEITAHLVDKEGNPYHYDYRIYYGEKNPEYESHIVYNEDGSIKYSRTDHIFGDGELTATLYIGDTIRIVNVDSGVEYYVEETAKDGYDENPTIEYTEKYGTGNATTASSSSERQGYYVVSGNTASSATVVNKFLDIRTQVDFEKTWYDADGNVLSGDDLPGKITIELFKKGADGVKVSTGETKEVSAATNWKGSFTDLPKFDNGVTIVYSVEESAIEGATYDDELEAFFEYDTEENNGKHAVLGQWKVMTLEDYILQNTWTPATEVVTGSTSFSIKKVDKKTGEALENATFELKPSDGTAISKTTDENGEATFDNLDAGTYTLKETAAPSGYKQIATEPTITITKIKKLNYVNLADLQNMYEFVFSISATQVAGYSYNAETRTVTVENEAIPYDDITITKVWEDENNHDGARPTSLKITLLADGEEDDEVTLDATYALEDDDNTWTHTFRHKPTTTVTGDKISYTIKEDETVLGDYEPSYDAEEDPLTITNSYTPKTTFVSGSKTWQYNGIEENFRPTSIKVGLYDDQKNKVKEATVTVDEDGNWSYFFYNLPMYRNEEGVVSQIIYSVKELEVEGTTYDNDSTFYKYDTEENNGKYAVIGKWQVQTLEDYILQNTWTPATETVSGTTSLKVVKIDAESEEKLQGAVFTLKADDGTETNLTTDQNGEATAENLDAGVYTITEVTAPDKHILLSSSSTITITKIKKLTDVNLSSLINTYVYEFTATATDAEGYTFDANTNTFTVENEAITYDDITVHKVWNDDSNRDGHRLDSVTISLIGSDGEKYEATLTEAEHANKDDSNTWDYTFENIPLVTVEGENITYTISEDEEAIGDYEPSYNQDTLTVTNTLEPELIDILGYKVWQDGDNISGLRPTSLELKLLDGDGNEIDSTIIFEDENGDWYFGFYDLPRWQNIDGEVSEIKYSVEEVVDLNYTVSYSEDEDGLIVVTNTLKGHGGNPEPPDTGRNTNAEITSAKITYGFGYVSIVLFTILAIVFSKSKASRK